MAYSVDNVKNMTTATLDQAIAYCARKAADLNRANKPATAAKFDAAKKVFETAKLKLERTIHILENTDDPSTSPTRKYIDSICDGKKTNLTLEWIGQAFITKGRDITAVAELNSTDADKIASGAEVNLSDESDITPESVRRNPIDWAKDFANDLGKGKGRAVGLARGLLGVGIAEVASRLVTGGLAKAGIMSEGMGLFGLLKTGVSHLPMAWPHIASAATAIWNFSPIGVCALGGLVVVKSIPWIKKKAQKLFNNFKDMDANKAMEENLARQIAAQPDPTV